MVQMVRRRSVAVLLRPRQAVLAAPTDAAAEADADEFADADAGVGLCLSWAQRDDPPDAFVPADVRQLDCCDGLPSAPAAVPDLVCRSAVLVGRIAGGER